MTPLLLLLSLALLLSPSSVSASNLDHRYEQDERVQLYVNKIGPYANSLETYPYYSLPYCHPDDGHETNRVKKGASIGEILEGHSLRASGFHLFFAQDSPEEVLCKQVLDEGSRAKFTSAVQRQ